MYDLTKSRPGYKGNFFSLKFKKFSQVIQTRDTVETDVPKRSATSQSKSPGLRRTSTKKLFLWWQASTSFLTAFLISITHTTAPVVKMVYCKPKKLVTISKCVMVWKSGIKLDLFVVRLHIRKTKREDSILALSCATSSFSW